jgi:hypothetical protein
VALVTVLQVVLLVTAAMA